MTSVALLTPKLQALGDQLLNHQCWFFGRDIWHPEGNLLIRAGFRKSPVPKDQSGSHCYHLIEDTGASIDLWGWGVFYGESSEGILVTRFDFRPRLVAAGRLASPVFRSDQLPPVRFPRGRSEKAQVRELTVGLIDWILRYEAAVKEACGTGWRKKNLREWSHAVIPAERIKGNWLRLRKHIEEGRNI